MHMDVNLDDPGVRQCLVERMKNSYRQNRHKLHMHFLRYPTLEEAKNNKLSFCVDKEKWDDLCDYFASEKYKRISKVNKNNKTKLRCKHISGRNAFTIRRHEISQRELNGEPCDRIDLYAKYILCKKMVGNLTWQKRIGK